MRRANLRQSHSSREKKVAISDTITQTHTVSLPRRIGYSKDLPPHEVLVQSTYPNVLTVSAVKLQQFLEEVALTAHRQAVRTAHLSGREIPDRLVYTTDDLIQFLREGRAVPC